VFHAGLLAFAILFGFATPLPLPEEQGILINFGTDDFGAGDEEPMYSEVPEESTPPPQEAVTPTESTEEIISQDFEDAPVVVEKPQVKKQEEVITPKEEVKPVVEEQAPPPEPEPRKANPKALYKGQKDTDATGSEGVTQGEGNQGSITGSPDSDNYAPGVALVTFPSLFTRISTTTVPSTSAVYSGLGRETGLRPARLALMPLPPKPWA